jgi:hypothetical protein
MRITNSDVSLASQYQRVSVDQSSASVRMWRERPAPPSLPEQARGNAYGHDRDHGCGCDRKERGDEPDEASGDYRMVMMRMLVEYFSGRRVDVLDSSDFEVQCDPVQMPDAAAAAATGASTTPAPRDPRGDLAIAIDVESTHYEHETAAFAARGQVQTGDGRTIDFAVDMAMEREQLDHSELHIRAGAAVKKDPLVLSLDGSAPRLTDDKVAFDIDADGTADRVSFVAPGAAFLALDRNANGTIDDGGELFGARTGDGFAELRLLDTDRDGWIDEDDAAFDQLLLWQRTGDGSKTLQTLRQAGVGAIYTRSAATPFELHGGDRAELGAVRSTGVFLRELGGAGVVQQIDLLA